MIILEGVLWFLWKICIPTWHFLFIVIIIIAIIIIILSAWDWIIIYGNETFSVKPTDAWINVFNKSVNSFPSLKSPYQRPANRKKLIMLQEKWFKNWRTWSLLLEAHIFIYNLVTTIKLFTIFQSGRNNRIGKIWIHGTSSTLWKLYEYMVLWIKEEALIVIKTVFYFPKCNSWVSNTSPEKLI